MDAKEWLVRWASDNIHEGYTDSAASMEQAAGDCLSAAEAEGGVLVFPARCGGRRFGCLSEKLQTREFRGRLMPCAFAPTLDRPRSGL